jgi:membrane protein
MNDIEAARTRQKGRGREAGAPVAIPPKGWKDVLWRLYRSIAEDRILLTAAGVTFYLVLAMVPTLTAVVALYGLFNDRASIVSQLALLDGLLPAAALGLIEDQLMRLAARPAQSLGITLIISLAIALWSASAGVKAMFEAMNVAYGEHEKRNFFMLNGVGLAFTLAGALAALLVAATVVVMPAVLGVLTMGNSAEWLVRIAAYLVLLLILSLALAALYRWGPSREAAKWRWITPGAALAVVLLGATSVVFSWYVTNVSDYEAAYGSLGAMIALLTWMWISVTIIIVGAELNSEIEHQTARDTTTGPDLPMGERGAHMADHVGRVWPPARKRLEPDPRPERHRERISWGAMAFALPAALVMHGLERRKKR